MIFSHDCSKNLKWIQIKPSLHKNIMENEVNDVCDSMAVNQSQTQQRRESMQRKESNYNSLSRICQVGLTTFYAPSFTYWCHRWHLILFGGWGQPWKFGTLFKRGGSANPIFSWRITKPIFHCANWLISNGMRQNFCVKTFLLETIFSSNQLIGCQPPGGFGEHETWVQGGNL